MKNTMIINWDEFESDDNNEYMVERVKKLMEFGFKFQGYGEVGHGDLGGCHVFNFDLPDDNYLMISDDGKTLKDEVLEILTEDDDSQPCAQYRLYIGSIWWFIPYYC